MNDCQTCGNHSDWIATGIRHCPWCGTVSITGMNTVEVRRPVLVDHVREAQRADTFWPAKILADVIRKCLGKL